MRRATRYVNLSTWIRRIRDFWLFLPNTSKYVPHSAFLMLTLRATLEQAKKARIRSWSTYDYIHNKRRNCLSSAQCRRLVYFTNR